MTINETTDELYVITLFKFLFGFLNFTIQPYSVANVIRTMLYFRQEKLTLNQEHKPTYIDRNFCTILRN